MKRIISIIAVLSIIFCLAACGSNGSDKKSDSTTPETVATTEAAAETTTEAETETEADDLAKYYGTWEADILLIDGSEYTVEDVEALGDTVGFCDMLMVIKKGGSVYIHSGGRSAINEWGPDDDEDTITVGVVSGNYINDNGQLCFVISDETIMMLKKTSDSQSIPKE